MGIHFACFLAFHSSVVISQSSERILPETYPRSCVETTRMPCLSDIRRDASFATAFVTRSTGKFRTLNQYSVTASHASVINPCPCHWVPIQNPRFVDSPFTKL